MLTLVNLLLRFVGTSFQVYISSVLGPSGVGLLQLVLSVGGLAMVAGMGGIRTATMYLTAEELGRKKKNNIIWILSGCMGYSIACSGIVGCTVYSFAPVIARHWVGDLRTAEAIRLFAAFLPVTCLCGVMTGYFTAGSRIGTLAGVEIAEQICSMTVTMGTLTLWAGSDPGKACLCVIFGSCAGCCLTLGTLVFLHLRKPIQASPRIPVRRRLFQAAVPLAFADVLKSGISTTENLMVPKRLARNPTITDPLASFGILSGMVFPVLMFPACILFGLAELLIPELARCAAAESRERIRYLVKRSLKVAMLYGTLFAGVLFLVAEPLCQALYGNQEAGSSLRRYAALVPILYCDAITDAMTKGLGQQKACVRYNILTNAMDVVGLYFLLPDYGMEGYLASFLVTHLLNFGLSLRRLLKITGQRIPLNIPIFTLSAVLAATWGGSQFSGVVSRCFVYFLILGSLLCLLGVTGKEDLFWIFGLVKRQKNDPQ